ncbi:hypothetical protein E4U55_001924 [Claviceps digitariae]|nr:hypothetical protein E4U55_001924 [Claviceps digitariae]
MDKIRDAAASLKALTASSHKYTAIPLRLTDQNRQNHHLDDEPSRPRSRFFKLSTAIMLFVVFLLLGLAFAQDRKDARCCVDTASCHYDPRKHWGQYSPYFSAPRGSIKPDVPSGCKVTFASVLSRHGARYPTKGKSKAYKNLIQRIQRDVKNYGKGFEFIKHYNYSLGADDLTRRGEDELFQSGKKFMKRYRKLAKATRDPFVRASGSDRVIKSAEYFLRGFYKESGRKGRKYLRNIFVIPEREGVNNPLDHGNCKAFEDARHSSLAGEQKKAWRKIWATPVMNRLNKQLPGANISLEDTVNLMDLCPFNTVTTVKTRLSRFCQLFSQQEWDAYEYYESVDKWYAYGPGNPLAPTQGVGYVNELIARLTKAPVEDHTTTNSTLDSDPTTFPLDRLLYADFTHDNTLMTVYGALGLYTNDTVLPSDRMLPPEKTGGYSASWAVPFGARMYVEKMRCGKHDDDELVRVLVNDRVVAPKGCKADKLGRCKLDDFLQGLEFAKTGGHWDQC